MLVSYETHFIITDYQSNVFDHISHLVFFYGKIHTQKANRMQIRMRLLNGSKMKDEREINKVHETKYNSAMTRNTETLYVPYSSSSGITEGQKPPRN